ncbi:macrolide family glycosyltransferase [Vreelandella olivaria]|uniref:macrolide family glycosyltransferase n=1 Tax=Vreelandella olivaria TaxID=390919 RepID=UPI00201F107A|nr:macrolide family glycosyltransferase [Halomonas olivaria]
MIRIIMIAIPAAGHVNPSVPLVRELVRRGINVTFYVTEEFRAVVEQAGATFRAYPDGTISSKVIADANAHGGSARVVQRLLEAAQTLLPLLESELRQDPPDAVMFDSNALWGRMLATSLRRPGISLMTTILVNASVFRRLTVRERLAVVWESATSLPGTLGARRRLLRSVGRDLLPSSPMFPTRGDLTIFPIPAWIQSPDDRCDASSHFVGPSIDTAPRTEEIDAQLERLLEDEAPLVVVSLGTLHRGGEDFFRSCIEAFAALPANVLLAVGRAMGPADFESAPSNIVVRAVVPQLAVLRQAAVFVTHGGMNSVMEGLHFGVPMVVIPQQVEQFLIGQAVADRGAGLVLRHHLSGRKIATKELRTVVKTLLDDSSYTASARTLAATLSEGGGAMEAADQIERLLGRAIQTCHEIFG